MSLENRKLPINNFDYPSKKGKQGKYDLLMDQCSFIIYLSSRDAILSRGMQRLVGESVKVLKIPYYTLFVQTGLVRPQLN
jgi:hypothetical protein